MKGKDTYRLHAPRLISRVPPPLSPPPKKLPQPIYLVSPTPPMLPYPSFFLIPLPPLHWYVKHQTNRKIKKE